MSLFGGICGYHMVRWRNRRNRATDPVAKSKDGWIDRMWKEWREDGKEGESEEEGEV